MSAIVGKMPTAPATKPGSSYLANRHSMSVDTELELQASDILPRGQQTVRTFPSRLAIVPETASFVEAFCTKQDVHRDDRLRLTLLLEELVANTIMHGHRKESDAPIRVALTASPHVIGMQYEDTAPAFDVVAALSNARDPLELPFDERPVGQLGLQLLAHYAKGVRYARADNCNRITLTLARSH